MGILIGLIVAAVIAIMVLKKTPVPPPTACTNDSDCAAGYVCKNGKCVAIIEPPTVTGKIFGQVIEIITQQPISGVSVSISPGKTGTTDTLGRFNFTNLQPGAYNVTFSKAGYDSLTILVNLHESEPHDMGDIELAEIGEPPPTGKATVYGRVLGQDARTWLWGPLSGVRVNIGGEEGFTDAQGRFSIIVGYWGSPLPTNPPIGLRLMLRKEGYEWTSSDVMALSPGENRNLGNILMSLISTVPPDDGDDDANMYTCPTCGKKFNYEDELNQHLITAHGIFVCPYCGKQLHSQAELDQHIIDAGHGIETYFPCQVCSRVFNTAENLKAHYLDSHLWAVSASLEGGVYAEDTHSSLPGMKLELIGGGGKLETVTSMWGNYAFTNLISSGFSGVTYTLKCLSGSGYKETIVPIVRLTVGTNGLDIMMPRV